MIYKKFLKYVILIFAIFYSSALKSDSSIYYIDVNFLINNSLAGKSIIKQLEVINKSTNQQFKKKEEDLKKQEIKITSQKNILSKEEYAKKVKFFSKQVSEYNLFRNNEINGISKIKNQAQKTLLDSLTQILAQYSKDKSISYIISKQNIIIGKKDLDLTNIILKILNSKIKNIKLS